MSTGKRSFLFKCNGSENVLNWTILCHLMSLSLTLSQFSIIEKAYLNKIESRAPQTRTVRTRPRRGHRQTSLAFFLILLCNEPLDLSYRSIKADPKGIKLNKLNVFWTFLIGSLSFVEQKIKKMELVPSQNIKIRLRSRVQFSK